MNATTPDQWTTEPAVERLCQLMAKYGLTRIQVGAITLERPSFLSIPDKDKEAPEEEQPDALERIARMSPDAQDRALALAPIVP